MASFGSVYDELLTGGEGQKANKSAKDATKTFSDLVLPEFEDIDPELFKFEGQWDPSTITAPDALEFEGYDPRLADLERVDRSNFSDISVDPRLKDEQFQSLAALDDIINGGGMTLRDDANMAAIQGDVAQADRGRREAILQNMGERGMGGSGMELLAQLQSSQAATDRASQAGLDVAGMAQQRALDAIMNSGNLAGGMRNQDFGEQAQIAQAQDAISRFNAQNANAMNQYNTSAANQAAQYNSQGANAMNQYNQQTGLGVQQYNADAQNAAGQFNATGRQAVSDANTQTANDAMYHNQYTVPQQQFQNSFDKATGKAGAQTGQANTFLQNREITRKSKADEDKNAQSVFGGLSKMGGG